MKLEDLIRVYGFPKYIDNLQELKQLIEKSKEESFKHPIEWWIIRFVNGKIFYYDYIKKGWEPLDEDWGFEK
jgi:hypothetical protein